MLLFYVGQDRYACVCEHILEIIPPIELKPIPHTPDYVIGSLIYGGKPLPVIDWCQLVEGTSCHSSFHTRIIIFRFSQEERVFEFGLMAERVTKTMSVSEEAFMESGVRIGDSPFLGGVLTDERGSIQFVNVERLVDSLQNIICGVG